MQNLKTMFRNGAIALTVGAAVSLPAYAAMDTAAIKTQMDTAADQAGTVAGYIALALSVLACAGVVFGMLRKA